MCDITKTVTVVHSGLMTLNTFTVDAVAVIAIAEEKLHCLPKQIEAWQQHKSEGLGRKFPKFPPPPKLQDPQLLSI